DNRQLTTNPQPMRITFLNPIGDVGGGERVLLAAIRGAGEHQAEAAGSQLDRAGSSSRSRHPGGWNRRDIRRDCRGIS
ncbi:MAG: hypothetical protein ACXVBO_19230, partial [Isosphaeraceae bacterium]